MSDVDAETTDLQRAEPTAARRGPLGSIVKIGFGVAVLAFGVVFVASRWSKVHAALVEADARWIAAACVFAAAGQWAAALGFGSVLTATSRRLPAVDVARMYFASQLGKYIPGSVWPIVAVTRMCRRYAIATRSAVLAGVLTMVFALTMGGLVGVVLVLVGAAGSAAGLWWLLLLIPLIAALVHPRVITAAVNLIFRLLRRESVDLDLQGPPLWGALGWPVASWLLLGLQCWALVVALGGPVLGSVAASVGGFALAYAAGTVVVFTPAGAGVREAVLGVALAGVIAGTSSDADARILVVVLLSRVLLAVLDFAQAGASVLIALRWSHAADPAETVVRGL